MRIEISNERVLSIRFMMVYVALPLPSSSSISMTVRGWGPEVLLL